MQDIIINGIKVEVGATASFKKVVTATDIELFGHVSGDRNPVHFDSEFAGRTIFKERIAHGILGAAYISAVFGNTLPGPGAIFKSLSLEFVRPVKIGDEVEAKVTVTEFVHEDPESRGLSRFVFDVVCIGGGGKPVITGTAVLLHERVRSFLDTEFVLVDEIDRVPPGASRDMLAAMAERPLEIGDFPVFATQNPIEPGEELPEAVRDRFKFRVLPEGDGEPTGDVATPGRAVAAGILKRTTPEGE